MAEQFHLVIVGIAEYHKVCFDKRDNYIEKLLSEVKEKFNKAKANSLAEAGYGG